LNEIDKVILVDRRFSGQFLSDFPILSTSEIVGFEGKIFCTPFTENSRATMRELALKFFPTAQLIFPK
jgi:hypothetical protein